MKNLIIKWLLILTFQYKKRKMVGPPNRFLVVSTTGLGDTLWAIPAIKALRQTYPNSFIAVLTNKTGEEVFKSDPHLDELHAINESIFFSLLSLLIPMRKKRFDVVINFHSSQRMVIAFCAFLGASELIGSKGMNKDLDFLFTKLLEPTIQHEIERRLAIVAQVGAFTTNPKLEFFINQEDDKRAEKYLQNHGITSYVPLIGFHPGAKTLFKQWDPRCFIELGKRLAKHLGCRIIVSGGEDEFFLAFEIASEIPGAIALAGELPVGAFAALLKRQSLFICNDSGPMHLATAVGTPTIALFGPTDPLICGPYHAKNTIVIERKKTCSPCLKKKCEEPFCLLQITPDEVYEKATKLYDQLHHHHHHHEALV